MFGFVLAFTAAVCWIQVQAELPPPECLWGSGLIGLAGLAFARFVRGWRGLLPVAGLCLGLAWAGLAAQWRMQDGLVAAQENRDVVVSGVVAALPQQTEHGWRFDFDVEDAPVGIPKSISLAIYDRGYDQTAPLPAPHAGERWRFLVRLKRPHANLNPQIYDFESWLLEQNIRATGYVRNTRQSAEQNLRLDAFVWKPAYLIERWREAVRERFFATLPDAPETAILTALTMGDQRTIGSEQWCSFARTGITHLVSISGLHVTMFAGLAWWLVGGLWRRSARLMLYCPVQQAAAIGGFGAAFAYCLLAGFAVPAQRTLYMLGVVALGLCLRRQTSIWRILAWALLIVLLLDPWAVLAPGFWLSFGAVALLFYIGSGRLVAGPWYREWGRAQWAMTLGMVPAMLLLFQQFSLVSPLANALAIPVVSFVVTPLALASIVPGLGWLLWPAYWVLAALMAYIEWLADLPWAVWQQHAPPLWALPLALAGSLWLFLPRGFPARWLGLLSYLPLLLIAPQRPQEGAFQLTVMDVGQGLAVHVQTARHDLLFDTGPAFSVDANSGNRILLPYLQALGVAHLDGLVVSHADSDHSGGAEAVVEGMPVAWMLTSASRADDLAALPIEQTPCVAGQRWQWDGVVFEMLYPYADLYARPPARINDMSCVLKVSAGENAVLLTGDIEKLAERQLLLRAPDSLRSQVLVVPHHGGLASSSEDFIRAVAPQMAVFSAGYLNRFRHPRPEVLARYAQQGARLLRTDSGGAFAFNVSEKGVSFVAERERRRRYWHGK